MKKVICAWCKVVIEENSSGGHGVCVPCMQEELAKIGIKDEEGKNE